MIFVDMVTTQFNLKNVFISPVIGIEKLHRDIVFVVGQTFHEKGRRIFGNIQIGCNAAF